MPAISRIRNGGIASLMLNLMKFCQSTIPVSRKRTTTARPVAECRRPATPARFQQRRVIRGGNYVAKISPCRQNTAMPEECDHDQEIAAADDQKALEWMAVLSAQHINYRLAWAESAWRIFVPPGEAESARGEIAAYEEDERRRAIRPADRPFPAMPAHHTWSPWWAAVFLLGFYVWLGPYNPERILLRRAAADPRALLGAGEWWRAITALFSHGDAAHLAGNILAMLFFSAAVCRAFGGGLGWAMILGAGAAGNILAAWLKSPSTVSFGASTACFGALGIMSMHQAAIIFRRQGMAWSPWARAWIPLGAGLSLLTLLGTGPASDLTAHLAGFAAGGLAGLAGSLAGGGRLSFWTQRALQMACLAVIIIAWRLALRPGAF